jgi:hypothetical protein
MSYIGNSLVIINESSSSEGRTSDESNNESIYKGKRVK